MTTSEKYNIPLLNSSNYMAWAVQMEMILREKRVWKVVTREEKQPNPNDEKYTSQTTSPPTDQALETNLYQQDLEAFETKVDRANATLFANMTQTIVNENKNHKEPATLWTTLQKRYAPKTTVSRMTASINFVNAKLNMDESIPDYLVRLTALKDRIVECGGTVDESMYKGLMFQGLPDEFDVIKANARINGDNLSADDVKDQILEQHRINQQEMMQADTTHNDAKAYATHHQQPGNSGKHKYSKKGKQGGKHGNKGKGKGNTNDGRIEKNTNGGNKTEKDSSRDDDFADPCTFCGEEGHCRNNCLKRRWYATQKKRKSKRNGDKGPTNQNASSTDIVKWQWKKPDQYSRPSHFAAITYFAATLQTKSPNIWLFDSDCDSHITPYKHRISEYRKYHVDESAFGFGGLEVKVVGEGHGMLVDEFGRQYPLKRMLYCPKAEHPMLSMMTLLAEGGKLTFRGTTCVLILPGGCTLHGKAVNNLLQLTDFGRERHTAAITTRAKSRIVASKNRVEDLDDDDAGEKGGEEITDEITALSYEIADEITDAISQPISNSEITDATSKPIRDSELADVMSATHPSPVSPPVEPKPLSPKYLWHLRLAHASTSVISKIPTIKSTFDSSNCESCIRAKMHKRPFPKSNFKATQKLQCIHSDLS